MDRFSLVVTLVYVAVSAVWILVSDRLVAVLFSPHGQLIAQTVKGWVFVLATGALIYLIISRKMRQRTLVEAELRQTRDAAVHADSTKARFLATMSHELRTPLNAINGFSEMMVRETFGPVGNPIYRQHAEIVHNSGRHLLELIDDLLDLSRLDLHQLEIASEPLRLGPLASEACRLMRGRAEEKQLSLSYDAAPGDDWVLGDRVRLKQVLLNLIGNAIRYTDEGGIEVRLRPADGDVVIEIADTGPGIDDGTLATMRTPFASHAGRQIEAPPRGAGAGLGLPLSHLLVERHGGSLDLKTALGKGTTVRLTLPRLGAAERTATAAD